MNFILVKVDAVKKPNISNIPSDDYKKYKKELLTKKKRNIYFRWMQNEMKTASVERNFSIFGNQGPEI